MAYSDDIASFVKWVKAFEEEVKNAVSATENLQTNSAALAADLDTLPVTGQNAVTSALKQTRDARLQLKSQARSAVLPIFAQIGRTINTPSVTGDSVTDLERFFRDWRDYQDDTADERVGGRAVSAASEPAGSDNGWVRRLRFGINGSGDFIESGRHNFTLTAKVTSKPAPWRAESTLEGVDGPLDALDYRAGDPGGTVIEHINEVFSGDMVTNPNMTGNADTADNAAVTVMTGWTLENTAGTPTLLIEKTAAKLWRSRTNTFSIAGVSTTKTISQRMPTQVLADPFRPVLPGGPVYRNTGWLGTYTIGWGSKSQSFTQADMTSAAWVWLFADRDADLYPVVFDQDEAKWSLAIATSSAAGANELVFAGFFASAMTRYQNWWYSIFSGDDEPALHSSVSFADTATNAGEIQDTLGFVFDDEDVGAYLMTSGTNLLADPA